MISLETKAIGKLHILQTNIQSLYAHKDELEFELKNSKFQVALLSETFTDDLETKNYNISGYNKILKSRGDKYGGVGIFLKNKLRYQLLNFNSTHNFEVVGVKLNKINLIIVSMYINPRISFQEYRIGWQELMDKLKNESKVIIGGDMNSHNIVWGCETSNAKGDELWNIVNRYGYIIHNNGLKTFIPTNPNIRPSAIDLTISSPDIASKISWNFLRIDRFQMRIKF